MRHPLFNVTARLARAFSFGRSKNMSETPQPDSPQAEANRAPVQPPLAQTSAARIEPVSSASATASRQAPPAMPVKDDDTLDGAAEMLVALKEAKPYLFTETERNTSPSRQPPAPKAAEPADVSQLPSEEYERSKHALLRAAMQKAVQSY